MSVSPQSGSQPQQTPRHQQSGGTSRLLGCVRESSPLPDPTDADAAFDSYTVATSSESNNKKRRFHPLRGLRRIFRRKPRIEPSSASSAVTANAAETIAAGESVSGEPAGTSLLMPDSGEGQPRSRSASELLGGSQELQSKRRSGGGLSGGSGGGSGCALGGGLSVSHDSVFTSDGRGGGGSPRGGSALQLPGAGELDDGVLSASASAQALAPQPIFHAGVRAELFEAVRRRRHGRSDRRSEDDEDEDLGFSSSPYGGSPTTVDVLMERSGIKEAPTKSHSTCSDGSLLSMGSSEMDEDSQVSGHSSKVSLHDRAPPPPSHEPSSTVRTDFDLEMVGENVGAPLSHSAARHKISVRPRRTHGAPRHHRRTNQISSLVLPTTPEANEEFSRNYNSDNSHGKRDLCLPESSDSPDADHVTTTPEPVFVSSSCSPPIGGMPLPMFFPRHSIPAGLSPNSPEALLASVMLERQLKSASLPPGLALPPTTPPVSSQEPTVKLSRSQSSSDPAGSPPGRPNYRRAHSAARIEHQAALANEALFKSRAMFGGELKDEKPAPSQPESISTVSEEMRFKSPTRKSAEEVVKSTLQSPEKEDNKFILKSSLKTELASPIREDKLVFSKPPQSRKSELQEPKSPVRHTDENIVHDFSSMPVPKPEARKMSNVALRQRIEPGLVSPEPPEEPSPPPWTTPANKVSVSHFIKLSDSSETADSLVLRQRENLSSAIERNVSIKNKVSGFHAMLQDAPSSLDSLEIETHAVRRLRSLSQSPVDSLERTELKISSDSLSSGADMSSTSDDPRPYRKHSRPRRPTPDTSDPEEAKSAPATTRSSKIRGVTRHSDPPFSGKNAVEITSVIRKSISVDSIRSSYSESINDSNKQVLATKITATSNDSISSTDIIDTVDKKQSIVETEAPAIVSRIRTHLKLDTKPIDILPLESSHLSLKCESVKTETEVTNSKSPPARWESKLPPRASLSTPNVPEFLRVQLNHVDSNTTASNVLLSSANTELSVDSKRQRIPSDTGGGDKQEEGPENEITSARVRLRKSFIEEVKIVEIAEKKQEHNVEHSASILNRRPSQIKRLELAMKSDVDSKTPKTEVISPTEKTAARSLITAEAKPKIESVAEKRYSSTFIQPKLSVATPQVKPVEMKPAVRHIPNELNSITIVSRATTTLSEPKESRASGVFSAKPINTEKPTPAPKQNTALPPPKVVTVEKSEPTPEVVLRRKSSAAHEVKDEQPELMKVFARRSLKLKDTDTWESQGSTQRSRDSDKENEESPTEIREKKVTESKSFNSSVANNNVPATVITNTNNNNNNGFIRKAPRNVVSMPSNSNHTNNNNLETVNSEVTLRQRSPENRPRPNSLADRIQGVWGGRNVELVTSPSSAAAPAAPLPTTVAADSTVDRSLTPRVRRRLDEWERWSKQTSRKEALP